jgi:hypothetical protein
MSTLSTTSHTGGLPPRLSLSHGGPPSTVGNATAGSQGPQSCGSTPPTSYMPRNMSSNSLALRPSGDSSRSALPLGGGSYIGPTPRSSMETTGSNIQQPGFVRKRINHWMTRLISKVGGGSSRRRETVSQDLTHEDRGDLLGDRGNLLRSNSSSNADAVSGLPGAGSVSSFRGLRSSRSYSALVDEDQNAGADLGTVEEVAGPHLGPTSFPIVVDQGRTSGETTVSEVAAGQPVRSSFQAAGGFIMPDTP